MFIVFYLSQCIISEHLNESYKRDCLLKFMRKRKKQKTKTQTKNKYQISNKKKLLNFSVGFVIVGNFLGLILCFFFSHWVRNCEWMAQNCEHIAESLALSCIFPESSSCMFRNLISFCSSLIILGYYFIKGDEIWSQRTENVVINVRVLVCQITYLLTLYYYNNKFGFKYYHDRHVHLAYLIWFSCMANS